MKVTKFGTISEDANGRIVHEHFDIDGGMEVIRFGFNTHVLLASIARLQEELVVTAIDASNARKDALLRQAMEDLDEWLSVAGPSEVTEALIASIRKELEQP